jgi:hypothetical protein
MNDNNKFFQAFAELNKFNFSNYKSKKVFS